MGPVHERIGGPRGRSGAVLYCVEIAQEFCELGLVCKKMARIRRRRDDWPDAEASLFGQPPADRDLRWRSDRPII
jgi:hypothetical protein